MFDWCMYCLAGRGPAQTSSVQFRLVQIRLDKIRLGSPCLAGRGLTKSCRRATAPSLAPVVSLV